MQELTVGTKVQVIDPSGWVCKVEKKITGRTGFIKLVRPIGIHGRNADYVVTFPAAGRRKEFTHHFDARSLRVVEE